MKNVNFEKKGNILTITVDLSKTQGPSSSGKTLIVGTTEGNVDVPGFDGGKLGLNLYIPNPDYKPEPKGQRKA